MKKRRINRGKYDDGHLAITGFGGKDVHGPFDCHMTRKIDDKTAKIIEEHIRKMKIMEQLGLVDDVLFDDVQKKGIDSSNITDHTTAVKYLNAEFKALRYIYNNKDVPKNLKEYLTSTLKEREKMHYERDMGLLEVDMSNNKDLLAIQKRFGK